MSMLYKNPKFSNKKFIFQNSPQKNVFKSESTPNIIQRARMQIKPVR